TTASPSGSTVPSISCRAASPRPHIAPWPAIPRPSPLSARRAATTTDWPTSTSPSIATIPKSPSPPSSPTPSSSSYLRPLRRGLEAHDDGLPALVGHASACQRPLAGAFFHSFSRRNGPAGGRPARTLGATHTKFAASSVLPWPTQRATAG